MSKEKLFLAQLFPAKRSKKPKKLGKLGGRYKADGRTRRQMLNQKLPPRKQPKFKGTGNNLPHTTPNEKYCRH
jgi:hypothetical protein